MKPMTDEEKIAEYYKDNTSVIITEFMDEYEDDFKKFDGTQDAFIKANQSNFDMFVEEDYFNMVAEEEEEDYEEVEEDKERFKDVF